MNKLISFRAVFQIFGNNDYDYLTTAVQMLLSGRLHAQPNDSKQLLIMATYPKLEKWDNRVLEQYQ